MRSIKNIHFSQKGEKMKKKETILLVLKATTSLPLYFLELTFLPGTKDKLSLIKLLEAVQQQ